MFKAEVIDLLRRNNSALMWYGVVLGAIAYLVWSTMTKVEEIHSKTVVLPGEVVNKDTK